MLFDACACECVSMGRCVEEDAQSPVKNVILADTDNLLVLNSGMCGRTQMESCIVSVFPFGLSHPQLQPGRTATPSPVCSGYQPHWSRKYA